MAAHQFFSRQTMKTSKITAISQENKNFSKTNPILVKIIISCCFSTQSFSPEEQVVSLLQRSMNPKDLKQIHAHMLRNSIQKGSFLVERLVEIGEIQYSRTIFEFNSNRNVFLWNTLIRAYADCCCWSDVFFLFHRMHREGYLPNNFTFPFVLKSCSARSSICNGKSIHCYVLKTGFDSNLYVANSLLDVYVKCLVLDSAKKLFEKMPERDAVSWNTMIAGCSNCGELGEAVRFFNLAPCRNTSSWNSMLNGYIKSGKISMARAIFDQMPERCMISWTSMIAGHCNFGEIDAAASLFDLIPEQNSIAWTAMITGYTQNGLFARALETFYSMQLARIEPDEITMVTVLSACASSGALELGTWVHLYMEKNGLNLNFNPVRNALIDMYSKCGNITKAKQVFNSIPTRTTTTYNTMMTGLAIHGLGEAALRLLSHMEIIGLVPDDVTFVAVLTACSHSGLVVEGHRVFKSMEHYSLVPKLEHYGCLIDLFGRAGHFDEAVRLIETIPMKPNSVIWGSLLGACRIGGKIRIAEYCMKKIIEVDPQNAGHYVVLSNIYAMEARWDKVTGLRKVMRERKIEKTPGCSLIEVNNMVHEFVTRSRSHKLSDQIYLTLNLLNLQLKQVGYDPNLQIMLDFE